MRSFFTILLLLLFALGMAGCNHATPTPEYHPTQTSSPVSAISTSIATFTPFQPSPTPQPLAALINGEGLTLAQFQAEMSRYQAALGTELATKDQQRLLNELIDQILLAQAAAQSGFSADEETVQRRMEQLATQMGGPQALKDWMSANGFTEESFRLELRQAMAAAWMRDQIIAKVPESAEQVHIRQILLYNLKQAEDVLAQLNAGADFATLAAQFDPLTGGDLGWLPRGYFLYPQVEQAVFALQPEAYSPIIQTPAGFHIVQVLERDSHRPLDVNMRQALQQQALQQWLEERRQQSDIQLYWP